MNEDLLPVVAGGALLAVACGTVVARGQGWVVLAAGSAFALAAGARRTARFWRRGRRAQASPVVPDERGVAVLELVLLVPAFLLLVYVVVGLGRLGLAREDIDAAARDAARAGSMARTIGDAEAAASAAANDALAAHDLTCAGLTVSVDTSDFRPGGWVRVDLSCTISLSDLSGIWTPGTRTMQARGLAVVDSFRRIG